jgi:serine protease
MSWKTLSTSLTGAAVLALSSFAASDAAANDRSKSESRFQSSADFRHAERPVEGRYIVVLKDEVARLAHENGSARANLPEVAEVAQAMARGHGVQVERSFTHALRGFVVEADDRALARLLLDERVAFIEEDGIVSISQTTQPNATWGLDRIDQRDRPLDGNYIYDTTASNVYTYIVDTGVRTNHNDFGGRVLSGFTSINDGNGTNDCNCHGTHVAGTVAGSTWGVAKAARIVPVRVLGCQGNGTNAGVIAGMDWVAANHVKPAVANMSLGGGASTATDNAVTNMRNAGVTVVVAAGNENQNACNVSPARSGNAITVGSTTSNDARSNFSNWGNCVDIFAPGSSIRSAWHTSNTAANTISGTSMAAPHVAGVAALFLANNPSATPAQVENAIYNNGSTGKLSGLNGSPNLLVYSRFGGGGGGPDPDPDPSELDNGVAVTGLSGAAGSERRYTIDVPNGAENLVIQISGGSGDADLYVRRGAPPTTSTWDCRPYLNGNNETCTEANPQAGTWHVMVRGYTSYSNVTLVASYSEPSSAPCSNCTQFSGSLSGTGQAQVQPNGTYYQASAGIHRGWLEGPSNADFDLELYRWNGSSWQRVAQATTPNSSEFIQYNGAAGFYYWRILSYSGSGSYDFWMQTP